MNAPLGPWCPGCGEHAALILILEERAMCGNDDCNIVLWTMSMTKEEAMSNTRMIDLHIGRDEI